MLVIVPEFKIIGKMPEKKVKENPWISFFFFFFTTMSKTKMCSLIMHYKMSTPKIDEIHWNSFSKRV